MEVERIKFERSGGFAGMRLEADLDINDLAEDDADALKELLDELDFAELPAKLTSDSAASDQFTYTITAEGKQWRHTVITGDSPEDEKMQELLELLNRLARKQLKN